MDWLEATISWLNLLHIVQSTQEGKVINSLKTECMDLETELPQEWKKDEDSIKDTLNELENEVGNIGRGLDDFATVSTSMQG